MRAITRRSTTMRSDKELAVAVAAVDRRRKGRNDRAAERGDEGGDLGAYGRVDVRIAHDALLEPAALLDLELRLDERDHAAARRRQRERRRQHMLERNEAHVDRDEVGLPIEPRRIERTDVGLLERDDLGPRTQPGMQLIATDIDRVDASRAAFDQDLGEAAGRGADVEAHLAGDVECQTVERMRELDAAARHPGKR